MLCVFHFALEFKFAEGLTLHVSDVRILLVVDGWLKK